MSHSGAQLDERFDGEELNTGVWFPYYLPHWSSREQSAATWFVRDGELQVRPIARLSDAAHDRRVDFPARDPSGAWADHVPELVVSSVKGSPLS